ncbi:uncharacterized protein PRCAT00001476001 [Priceomyces carsonii]|uniref:uncharacterized protein n=1 Tax=Priceomyces carsonii TaxID=28549 RepID=UPI002ED97300|nr:unnamed protein product [Priceomyces carsonii]
MDGSQRVTALNSSISGLSLLTVTNDQEKDITNSSVFKTGKSLEVEHKNLVWIDQSGKFMLNSDDSSRNSSFSPSSINGITDVRRRLEKRKRRDYVKYSVHGTKVEQIDRKRVKNTLAARRYRERRQKEVEILDERVRELEKELSSSLFEARWWKMEAQRWRELCELRLKN